MSKILSKIENLASIRNPVLRFMLVVAGVMAGLLIFAVGVLVVFLFEPEDRTFKVISSAVLLMGAGGGLIYGIFKLPMEHSINEKGITTKFILYSRTIPWENVEAWTASIQHRGIGGVKIHRILPKMYMIDFFLKGGRHRSFNHYHDGRSLIDDFKLYAKSPMITYQDALKRYVFFRLKRSLIPRYGRIYDPLGWKR